MGIQKVGGGVSDGLKIGVRLALTAAVLVMVSRYAVRVFDPGRRDYGEGPILAMVQRMQQEEVSPKWLGGPPYTLSCYGPGYYWSVRAASAVLPWDGSLIPGRLVALAAAVATAGLIAYAVGRKVRNLEIALLGGLLYLVSSVVFSWVPYQRVDSLAVLFAVGAYVAAERPGGGLAASALLAAVGSLVKPTAALAAVPIFVYLVLGKRYRDAVVYAVLTCVLGAAFWWSVDCATDGYYLTTVLRANLNRPDFWHGLRLAVGFLQCPAALVGILVAAWLAKNEPRKALGCPYCVGFALSWLIAMAAASKEGASINYYLEPCALAAVVIGRHGVPRVYAQHKTRVLAGLGVLSLVLVVPGVGDFPSQLGSTPRLFADGARLREVLEGPRPVPVLADGPYVDVALAAGAEPMVNDPFVFRLMVDNGTLPPDELVEAMRRGTIPYLLLGRSVEAHRLRAGHTAQRWPLEVLDAMQRHYRPVAQLDGLQVYRYRPELGLGRERVSEE